MLNATMPPDVVQKAPTEQIQYVEIRSLSAPYFYGIINPQPIVMSPNITEDQSVLSEQKQAFFDERKTEISPPSENAMVSIVSMAKLLIQEVRS
jgi:hypothetical protein